MTAGKAQENKREPQTGEEGNVLFLILIAVVLFAALSYAVTQSSRSGSGDAGSETNLVNSAQLTQYPASIRTAIVRMIVGGTPVSALNFNPPADFANLESVSVGVFHPQAGGGTYALAPNNLMAAGTSGTWHFNASMEIPQIGTAGADGNDLIAFLPGITLALCSKINGELGLPTTPPVLATDVSGDYLDDMVDPDGAAGSAAPFPTATDVTDIDDGSGTFDGKPFGCFRNGPTASPGDYVYYHVLVER